MKKWAAIFLFVLLLMACMSAYSCENHFVESISHDWGVITLDDHSVWEVNDNYKSEAGLWEVGDEVRICANYYILNIDENDKIYAVRTK